ASLSLSTSFFHFRESFFSRPRRGNSLARTALCAFSTPPSSIFPQKIEKMFSNRQKGAHTSWIADFQSAVENHTALRKKSKVFHIIFYTI
ncbi:hypothetical protein, partial [Desulfovibrio sp.]|uniref:hypothetical protein n=1 Tax=Desulfovibrio sp. TaxID=885 RepID=UPI00307B4C88